jgi:hypothetical protein
MKITPSVLLVGSFGIAALFVALPNYVRGQENSARGVVKERPPLFFREDWKTTPAAEPLTQDHVANASLILGLYGPGKDHMRKSHHETPADDPYYAWSGRSTGNWVIALRKSDSFANLTGKSKARWRTMQTGLRQLHLVLKLANGTWLVSDQASGPTTDWREEEYSLADLNWHALDINTVIETRPLRQPDLSKVDEIGWTDLMTGGSTPASSRLDWIEVYGWPIAR